MHAAKLRCIFEKYARGNFSIFTFEKQFSLFFPVCYSQYLSARPALSFMHDGLALVYYTSVDIHFNLSMIFKDFPHTRPSYSTLETKQQKKNHSSLAPATLVCAVNIWNSLPASQQKKNTPSHSHNSQAPVWHERPATMDVSWLIEWLENIKTWPINSQRSPTPNHPLNSRQLPQLIFHHIKFLWLRSYDTMNDDDVKKKFRGGKETPSR